MLNGAGDAAKPPYFDRYYQSPSPPCKAKPTKSDVEVSLCGRSDHNKALPQLGCISALRVVEPLTSMYSKHPATLLTATQIY